MDKITVQIYDAQEVVPMPDVDRKPRSKIVLLYDGDEWEQGYFSYNDSYWHKVHVEGDSRVIGIVKWFYLPD